ncbi:MAG: hypothetical protein A3F13_06315 [Gammaproteobacteria bacterium RIFCSPHIGHO2_12_FULL_40_19]|nr:MAG: hypothetical protein A3F13_06315 [Gammaproteobacteria bacterium RIFCSPHIGHO2_12_FULL_40_19]
MLKQLKLIAIPSLLMLSVSAFAQTVFLCPQLIKCLNDHSCKKPPGYQNWRLSPPIKPFYSGRFHAPEQNKWVAYFFYGTIYTKFPDDVTITCLYKTRNGPYLYLEKAGNFKPILYRYHKYQWEDKGYGRYSCTAAYPEHCPYESN